MNTCSDSNNTMPQSYTTASTGSLNSSGRLGNKSYPVRHKRGSLALILKDLGSSITQIQSLDAVLLFALSGRLFEHLILLNHSEMAFDRGSSSRRKGFGIRI